MSLSESTTLISIIEFEHLKFENQSDKHILSLVDTEGYSIVKGFGNSLVDAINYLHHNLI
jgi:hypothetical protein